MLERGISLPYRQAGIIQLLPTASHLAVARVVDRRLASLRHLRAYPTPHTYTGAVVGGVDVVSAPLDHAVLARLYYHASPPRRPETQKAWRGLVSPPSACVPSGVLALA